MPATFLNSILYNLALEIACIHARCTEVDLSRVLVADVPGSHEVKKDWQQLLHSVRAHASVQRGCGFKSCQVQGFFSFLYPLSSVSMILVPQGGATLLIFL